MKKVKKILKALFLLIKQPSLINKVTEADEVWDAYIVKHYPKKRTLPVVQINDLIPNFNEELNTFSFLGGGSMPTDIILLKALAKQITDCSYFEIGTWRGESVLNVAENAKECFTLNLSEEEMLQMNLPKEYASLHGFFSKGKDNITHLYGNSLHFDYASLNKKFDLIFIDGNHKYDYVKSDTQKVFEHLVKEDTIVVWHDYAYNPEKIRSEILAGILDGLPKEFHENLYHVSNTMCAIYTTRKLATTQFTSIQTPNMVFNVKVKTNTI